MRKVFELETIERSRIIPVDIKKHKLILTDEYIEKIFDGVVHERTDEDSPMWDRDVDRKILELIPRNKVECIDLLSIYRLKKEESTESIYQISVNAPSNNIHFEFMELTDAKAVYNILRDWLIHTSK